MKKSVHVFFIAVLLSGCFNNSIQQSVFAQSPTTQGKEFYFSFMQNGYRTCNSGGSTTYESLSCIISAKRACSGTISNPNTLWSINFNVTANGITTITIPMAQSYSTNSEIAENYGLIVTATDTISLFIANEALNSFDASNVLPLETLGDKYITQNYIPSPSGVTGSCNTNVRSAFIIIATENNTIIDITPTCNTKGGKAANISFSIALNKGQSYQVMSNDKGTAGDLSGSLIQARDCKRIAVFNGNIITGIPQSITDGFDHIFEQAMPVSYWGNKFAITASMARNGDYIRVTALNNNTEIKINNIVQTTINERNTYEFFLSNSSYYLETSEPCAVFLYQTSNTFDSSTNGDPSMVWITPVEQQVKEITFGTFTATNTIVNHYINIVTATTDINSIRLDNVNISNQFQQLNGNSTLSIARINISHGAHTLRSNTGFTAFVYGFGNVRGYAYSIGSSAIDLRGNIIANQIHTLNNDIANTLFFCKNELLHLKLNINYEFDSINWKLGDGTIIYGRDSIIHAYASNGKYFVEAIVKLRYQNCTGSIYDTIKGIINIQDINETIRDTVCYGEIYNKHGLNITALHNTSKTQYLISSHGCDSTVVLYLTVLDTSLRIISDTILSGEPYNKWGFNLSENNLTYIGTNTHSLLLTNRFNCDSLHILSLTIKPRYLFTDSVTICQLGEIYWRNKKMETANAGIFILSDTLKTIYWNTDSIYRLILTVKPNYFIIDTINVCLYDNINWHNKQLTTSQTGMFTMSDSLKTIECACDSIHKLVMHVNPIPELYTILSDETICSRTNTSEIIFSGSGNMCEWTASGDIINGMPLSGKDIFERYTLVNSTNSLLTTTISVIPKSYFGDLVCSGAQKSFNISVYPDIKIDAVTNKALFCYEDTIYLEIVNPGQLQNYQWDGPDGFSSKDQNPVIKSASSKNSGSYIVQAHTLYHCDAIPDTVLVHVLSFIDANLPEDTVLCTDPITISTTYPYGDYSWNTGETTRQISISSSGTYCVEINDRGCLGRDTVSVRQIIIPPFKIQTSRDICYEDDMEVFVHVENADYFWNTGDTTSSIIINSSGEYTITVFIEGCFTQKYISVFCDCNLWIPNTFTPNNDNTNEIFIPIPTEILNTFSMSIYDRWGNLVFKTNSYTPWDGTANGKYATAGSYSYIIYFSCINDPEKKIKKQGRINLIR